MNDIEKKIVDKLAKLINENKISFTLKNGDMYQATFKEKMIVLYKHSLNIDSIYIQDDTLFELVESIKQKEHEILKEKMLNNLYKEIFNE